MKYSKEKIYDGMSRREKAVGQSKFNPFHLQKQGTLTLSVI